MGSSRRAYGSWSGAMLRSLRARGTLKVEALVAYLGQRGIHIDRSLVSHWIAGRTHLPADILPHLADFTGEPERVFGEYVRAVDCELVRIHGEHPEDEDLVDLLLTAGSLVGGLQQTLREARAPESPGGVVITAEERAALKTRLDELIQLLADVRARLRRERAASSPTLHA